MTSEKSSVLERGLYWLGLGLIVAFTLYSLYPIHGAWWSIIDDHRKPYIYSMYHGLSLSDILHHFWHAVDFPPLGDSPRVQPMYHVLNELELWCFGLNPGPWYAMRIVYALVFSSVAYATITRLTNSLSAFLLTGCLLIPAYLTQVFLRLGVAECYIAPALAIAVWICIRSESDKPAVRYATAAVYLLCLIVALGAKEVMLAFVPAIFLRAVADFRRRGPGSPRFIAGVIGMGFGVFIAVMIERGLRNQTVDIYGNSLSLTHRLALLVKDGWFWHAPSLALAVSLLLLAARCFLPAAPDRTAAPSLSRFMGPALVVTTAFLASVFFYNCVIPPNSHYEFPVTGLESVGLFIVVMGIGELILAFAPRLGRVRGLIPVLAGAVCLTSALCHSSPLAVRRRAESIREDTLSFKAKFLKLEQTAKAHPNLPIVFHSCGFNDVEPTDSVLRFLRGFGVHNRIVLDPKVVRGMKPATPWEAYLKQLMLSKRPGPNTFDEVTDEPKGPAIDIDFSNSTLSNGALLNFWPMR